MDMQTKVAGLGTIVQVSGFDGRIIQIDNGTVDVEIIEGLQLGRVVTISFKQVEKAAGLR